MMKKKHSELNLGGFNRLCGLKSSAKLFFLFFALLRRVFLLPDSDLATHIWWKSTRCHLLTRTISQPSHLHSLSFRYKERVDSLAFETI